MQSRKAEIALQKMAGAAILLAAFFACGSVAFAADGSSHTGFSLGISAGRAHGKSKQTDRANRDITEEFDLRGSPYGANAGYHFQTGRWIYGLEVEYVENDIYGSGRDVPPFNANFVSATRLKSFETARARAGYTWPGALVYLTAGLATGRAEITVSGPGTSVSETKTRHGWAAGGGVGWTLTQNWSVRAEYMYLRFRNAAYFDSPPAGFADRAGGVPLRTEIYRLGLNYTF
jgi:outer membrane immunogenic protein